MQKDDAQYCYSFWNSKSAAAGTDQRGQVDRNFAHADGSVLTLRNLMQEDARLVRVPGLPFSAGAAFYYYLPPD